MSRAPSEIRLFVFLVFLPLFLLMLRSQEVTAQTTVQVLQVAQTDDHLYIEQQFANQLRMDMGRESCRVRNVPDDFLQLPLSRQLFLLNVLCPIEGDFGAVFWLEHNGNRLRLVGVFTGSGHVKLQTIEVPGEQDASLELALAAREWMGAAFMNPPTPQAPSAPKEESVAQPVKPDVLERTMYAYFNNQGSLTRGFRSYRAFGGGIGLGFYPREFFPIRLSLSVLGSKSDNEDWGGLKRASLLLGASMGYLWSMGPIQLGPTLNGQLFWTHMFVSYNDSGGQLTTTTNGRFGLGALLRIRFSQMVAFVLEPQLGANLRKDIVLIEENRQRVFSTPVFYWGAIAGIEMTL